MNEASSQDNKYAKSKTERQKHVKAVLSSSSNKKIVVAGPGTGKTYLFKEILKGKKNTLTLTFVNALVEDLSLELYGVSDVKTLHGFARSLLSKAKKDGDVKIYPKLPEIIKEDAKIILDKEIDFDQIFHNLDDETELIEFYKNRKNYYGEYYGYSDIIYAIVKYFENKKEKIPEYQQVVVDEFQDFNKLEVALIDLLSEKNPVLLAGDDDQALYDFKNASPDHIRQKYNNKEFTSFTLPYCSRCTNVIVEATNDIINSAVKAGNFSDRIEKEYKYFDDERKDNVCATHPNITYGQMFATKIPWFIDKCIRKTAEYEKGLFDVLIISPTKRQTQSIASALREKGYENVQYLEKRDKPSFLDGLLLLLESEESNLGWRIVCKSILNEEDYKNIINNTNENNAKSIHKLININKKKEIKKMLKVLRAVKNEKKVDEKEFNELLNKISLDPFEMAKDFLKNDILFVSQKVGDAGVRKIPIKATTIQSSKGLSAEYVFITYFDDQYFIKDKDKITDKEICNFLVALTRAKKKVFLISSGKKEPTFLKWINSTRIEIIK